MKTNAEWSSFLKKAIGVCKNITLTSQVKIYFILSSVPLTNLAIQSIENEGMQFWETISLASLSTAIGYYLNSYIKKTNNSLQKCLEESENNSYLFKQNIENLELLLKNIPGIWFFVMKWDTYVKVNENFARMTWRSREEITWKTDKELFPLLPDHVRNRLLESNNDSLKNNNQETLEETISLPLHDWERIIMLKKSPFVKKDKKLIIGVAIDITAIIEEQNILQEQKQLAEDLVKKTEEMVHLKSAFLANMSHELRTPLNAIIWFSELILTQKDEGKQIKYEHIERINKSWYDLLYLIDNTLEISKIDAGMFRLTESLISLQKTIDEVVQSQSHSINKNPNVVILSDESIENIDINILSDNMRIKQVLNNLIGNAIKFTDQGQITVSFTKIEDIWDCQKIYLSIKDTGIGIAQDNIDTIFDRFRQIDNSSTRQYAWSWLWLSLAKEISQNMGWDITVESKLWKWSTFTFSFIAKKHKEETKQENNMIEINLYQNWK
jgi:two-component system, sensor histidine kinase and response regulator